MSSSITAPVTGFTGVSKFASSLQQVLTRSVGIASLPLNSLQAGLTTLNNKQSSLRNLDTAFANLTSAVGSLQNAITSGLLSSSVSNGSIVSATVGSNATPGTYTIEVDNLGSYSTALSTAGSTAVSDPSVQGLSTAPSVTLTVGTTTTTITPASTSLQDLASAINSQAGSQVQATLVNVGSTSTPDYRLSLSAARLGTDAIGLTDSLGANLVSSSTTGALASYIVDGTGSVTSDSRTVTLSPGLTANLIGQSVSGQPATIIVRNDPSQLASALSSFAQAYNSAAGAVNQQRTTTGGSLQGDSLLYSLGGILGSLATYSTGSPDTALANYGVTVDQTGVLSVDTTALTAAANANFAGLRTTLGSSTSGFIQAATSLLTTVEDATTGLIPGSEASITKELASQNAKITEQQSIVSQLQTNLTAQIAKADSTLAGLESRVSYITGLFAQYTGANSTQSNGLSTL